MNKRNFIAQQGSNSTIKVFEASTGQLYRIIAVGGKIVSTPVVADNIITVTVECSNKKMIKTFSLPNGGLKSTIVL